MPIFPLHRCLIHIRHFLAAGAFFLASASHAAGVEPLLASIDTGAASRFAQLFATTGGHPSEAQIARDYLANPSRGVEIFLPGRIESAAVMARAISADPQRYAYAIATCLPLVPSLTAELRATYLAYRGLLPEKPLPEIHIVFGSANSGGTAAPDAQVIGLEVMCGPGTTPDQFRSAMRNIFAHETAHSWQGSITRAGFADPLMLMAIREGTPDYLASLVTGSVPTPARDAWAGPQEAALWAAFQKDRATVKAGITGDFRFTDAGNKALHRWFANYGAAPEGWPFEAGYWIGMRIAQRYVEGAQDKRKAIRALLAAEDPAALLAASGYGTAPGKDAP